MLKSNRLWLLFFIGFCLSCNQDQIHFSFEKEISLTGVEAKVKGGVLNPLNLIAFDSLLLIQEPFHTRKKLKILNLNDFNIISNAIWLGKGPGEMVNPANWVVDTQKKVLWFSDWGKHSIFKFPIDSLVSNPDFYASDYINLNNSFIPMTNMFYHPSGNFDFSSFYFQKNLVSFINKKGEQVDSLAIPNKLNRGFWENAGISDNPLILHYNSHHKKIVVADRYNNYIAVIDEDGNPIFQLEGAPIKVEPSNDIGDWSKHQTFYLIKSDQDFIYCLYRGGARGIYDKEIEGVKSFFPAKLLVFDWQVIAKYDISLSNETKYFTIDTERKRLIGNTSKFENGLIIYDLTTLKNN